jgi:DNA-directed RNA polymerase specialized sigma24 family protein
VGSEVDAEEVAEALRPIYADLRRFAAVVGPIEVEPDDLVQEAVVRLLASEQWEAVRDLRAYLRY